MNERNRRVSARFGPETKFEVKLSPGARLRARQDNELERLKGRLLAERQAKAAEAAAERQLRRAANDAAAMAWATGYPLLMFPGLFEEKATAALLRAERQEQIRQRSRELLAA